jgi:hypothetical protein
MLMEAELLEDCILKQQKTVILDLQRDFYDVLCGSLRAA